MPLAPGHRLGSYQIVGSLGAGGMGEVYRARDTALDRDVAIKVLPDVYARDPEMVERLTREARALAALNHPNIAHVHGLDNSGSARALVMELVEGEDLSQRIARGAMPLAEALPVARQIAEALEAAHEHGIVHRDLKPANVRLRRDGTVKVVDFGLAKTLRPGAETARLAAESPTLTAMLTEHGLIVGSAAYMAPEQARGQVLDKRADIWAFGALLYEMLTGTRAFRGDDFAEVLAAVLRREIDWSRLPADTPAALRQLLERCLTTDVKQRLRDIGEARVALAALEREPQLGTARETARDTSHRWRERVAWMVASVAIAAAVYVIGRRVEDGRPRASTGATRLSVLGPPGLRLNPDSANAAISPDGRSIAFIVGPGIAAEHELWVRSLDSPVPRQIESGRGATLPFWSPDSARIGFFAERKLKIVAASGGPAEVICDAPFGRGGTWNAANVIVFAPDAQGPLYRVAAAGGKPQPVTQLDRSRNEQGHRFPRFLPDGDRFLFATIPIGDNGFGIVAGSVQTPSATIRIGSMETVPTYAHPGWLLFGRQGVLAAQRFDARSLQLSGDPILLGDQPGVSPSPAAYEAGPRVSAAADGSLVYYLPTAAETRIQWMNAAGQIDEAVAVPAGRYTNLALAPDDTHAVLVREDLAGGASLWVADLRRGAAIPLATDGRNTSPVWSPDGKQIVFGSDRGGHRTFYVKAVGDSSPERRLAEFDDRSAEPRGWTHDGKWIIFSRVDPGTRWNVYRIAASGGTPELLIGSSAVEMGARTSPDDRWLAYLSDETGSFDVFVHAWAPSGAKLQVSTGGAQMGWWGRTTPELFYLGRDSTLWRVPLDLASATPRLGSAQQLGTFPPAVLAMDRAADGRFLAIVAQRTDGGAIAVVQSWQAALTAQR